MEIVSKIKKMSIKISASIASICLLGMMLFIVTEIILRWIFNTSTMIETDFSSYGLGAVMYLGVSKSFDEGAFVKMDVLFESYKGKFKKLIMVIFDTVLIVFNFIITYYFSKMLIFTVLHNSKANNIYNTPLIYPRALVFLGIVLFSICLICRLIEDIAAPIEQYSVKELRKIEAEKLEEELRIEEAKKAKGEIKEGDNEWPGV